MFFIPYPLFPTAAERFYLTGVLSCQTIACTLRSQVTAFNKRRSANHNIQLAERLSKHPAPTLIYFLSVCLSSFSSAIFLDCILDHLRTPLYRRYVFFGKRRKRQSYRPISIPGYGGFPSPQNTYFHGSPSWVKIISLTAC